VLVWVMYQLAGILFSVALTCSACSRQPPPEQRPQVAFFRVADYRTWTCEQLLDEEKLLSDALAVSTEHAGAPADRRIAYIKQAEAAVRTEIGAKSCKT
jgi:hypothetical protein